MAEAGDWGGRAKKEIVRMERERKHLNQNLAGIKDMNGLPDLLFVIDSNKEAIAVEEARLDPGLCGSVVSGQTFAVHRANRGET